MFSDQQQSRVLQDQVGKSLKDERSEISESQNVESCVELNRQSSLSTEVV